MFNSLNRQRVWWILLLSGAGLSAYYLLIYRPLSRTTTALDRPLTNVWLQLVTTNADTRKLEGIDLAGSNDSLRKIQAARRTLAQDRKNILSRIALEPILQAKLDQPFQLIEFQHERQLRVEEITRLAKKHSVTLDPNIVAEYPRYTAEEDEPAMLWAELAVFHHAVAAAVLSKVTAIRSAKLLPGQTHPPLGPGDARLLESRVTLDLTAPMTAASQFLLALPLTSVELKSYGLPESTPAKPALFIEKWMLRKASAEKPNEVQLNLTISGFSFSQVPGTNPDSNFFSSTH